MIIIMKGTLSLKIIQEKVKNCKKCDLCTSRKNAVPGKGDQNADIVFVGEAPGKNEDECGEPFIGTAGKKLNDALKNAGLERSNVYITNIVKCRPPKNRKPSAVESEACMPWLNEQINLLKPKIIILAGSTAVQSFLGIDEPISKIRGQWIEKDNIKYMPIFHPSYLLRNPSKNKGKPKWLTWQDLKKVKKELISI